MKKLYILMLGLLMSGPFLFGQADSSRHTLSLQLGPSMMARQDLLASPFVHRDVAPVAPRFGWRREGRFVHAVQLSYAGYKSSLIEPYAYTGNRGEDRQSWPHSFTFVNLRYDFLKPVAEKEALRMRLGLRFDNTIQVTDYIFGRAGLFNYFASFALGPVWEGEWQTGEKHRLRARVGLPILAWVARSPYLLNDDTFIENISSHKPLKIFFSYLGDGSAASLNRLQKADLDLEWQYAFKPRWTLTAGYHFQFIHHNRPLGLLSYRNDLSLGLQFAL